MSADILLALVFGLAVGAGIAVTGVLLLLPMRRLTRDAALEEATERRRMAQWMISHQGAVEHRLSRYVEEAARCASALSRIADAVAPKGAELPSNPRQFTEAPEAAHA